MYINERLKALRLKLGLTQPEIALEFGIPLTSWKKYEAGPSEPGSGPLSLLVDGGVNVNWILTGRGNMFNEGSDEPELIPLWAFKLNPDLIHRDRASETADKSPINMQDFELIPLYDVEASAGNGSLIDQELQAGQLAFKKAWIKQKGLQAEKCVLIKARGDSMEPTIYDGDLLLVDRRIDSIIDDTIYIVQTDNRLIVKRIQKTLDGSLTIISDNKKYREQIISPDQAKDIKIAGRVRWYGHEI